MFAIYNKGSVGFRSTVDNLYSLNNIENIQASRFNPDEGTIQNFDNLLNKQDKETKKEAINMYKKMANIDTSEIIYQAKDIMTKNPKTITSDAMVVEALNIMEDFSITQLVVADQTEYKGILHLHDILKEGII